MCLPGYKLNQQYSCVSQIDQNCNLYERDYCSRCKNPLNLVYYYTQKYPLTKKVECQVKNVNNPVISMPNKCEFVDFKGFCVVC